MVSVVVMKFVGCDMPTPSYFDDLASLGDPKWISRLCGELYLLSFKGMLVGVKSMSV